MPKRTKLIIAGVVTALVIGAGAGIGAAVAGGDDSDTPITGPALEKASAAALEHTGEGEVTDTEVGDEDGYYEVEVTLDDGSQVDIHLDEDFNVIGADDPEFDTQEDEADDDNH